MSNYQPPPPGYGYPPPPLPPPKPSNAGKIIGFGCLGIIALAFLFAIIGVLSGGDNDSYSSTPAPAAEQPDPLAEEEAPAEPEPEEEKPKPKPKPKGPDTSFGDGTYLVGEDIKAGTYKTAGPQDNAFFENCYWARSKDDSGELDSIIANNNTKGPTRVTLNKGEVFETNGCEKWKLAD